MAGVAPLTADEAAFFRALMEMVASLRQQLDLDLIRSAGLTANEYSILRCLSEASNRECRMAELASAACVSPSRMSRLVDDLRDRGLVEKRPISTDRRGYVAKLTTAGVERLNSAWPAHIASVRRRVFDHLDPAILAIAADALSSVAATMKEGASGLTDPACAGGGGRIAR
jgi:DNA-binding MarR family transcriptional regulator